MGLSGVLHWIKNYLIMKRILLFFTLVFTFSTLAYSQSSVSGTITGTDGVPLIGVNILEKGTSNGTVTDVDGNYSITVPSDATLIISYTGFTTREIAVAGQSSIDITLSEGVDLSEVVVTALGISREQKSLSYSAQTVTTDELSQARDLNVINGLSGKVAGLSIARSGSGVGAPSRVILRGNRSLAGNSQPLYVVDGVPILGDITDINPDDIESISVLKGANAAALYGNRAQNGAIIMTTKKGTEGFKVSVNSTYMAESPLILRNYQTQYGQGNGGQYSQASEDAWGAPIGGSGMHWSRDPNWSESTYPIQAGTPVEDFFQTGHNWATSLAISGGTAKTQTYFSYTYTDAAGVVPNNEFCLLYTSPSPRDS